MDNLIQFIKNGLAEDIGPGDYSALACIPANAKGKVALKVKEAGVLAGCQLAQEILKQYVVDYDYEPLMYDGQNMQPGDIAFTVTGATQKILTAERLILNCMQRMSAIATITRSFVDEIAGTQAKILDTRKTTPLCRTIEKWAVRIGGGYNHRFGLYDMIMIKDNHVDFCGGIEKAIDNVANFQRANGLTLQVEIETRDINQVKKVLAHGGINRIMLDNFNTVDLSEAVTLINNTYETEASGGIKLHNVRSYALTGVNFISVGALTHGVKSLDLSLKAV
ncbi:MAG: carboxylating nicotinate-nucleotide diphosphorylase [Bacteroidia bacterium]|nr:carboxylating nicotinate-nucleotide diphosphorylase [Bacteroidia bacterium]HQV01151.1 carboxylating nicotinate-nucleotide diphosphorylase [Bacteroidia bacterium]